MDFSRTEVHTTTLTATIDAPTIQALVEAGVRDKAGIPASQPGVIVAADFHVTEGVLSASVRILVDHTQVPTPAPAAAPSTALPQPS